ncbi:MAG: Gfo/Idh/MocA family oxidoreductase [Aggregatilineales bacterium]
MTTHKPIRIALIGSGIFARDAHLPALLRLSDRFQIAGICSQSHQSAAQLAELLPYEVKITTDYNELLRDDSIDAVDILLPIPLLPEAAAAALDSGKHIISEKPIAPTVAMGKSLINQYRAAESRIVWMVAENWRYEPAFARAGDFVRSGDIGAIVTAYWALHVPVTPELKYYHTSWRRSGDFPGGFLLDAGVHHIAALRLTVGEIVRVSASVAAMRDDLPPADTLSAVLEFENGAVGHYTVTYAVGSPFPTHLHVIGMRGGLRVDTDSLEVIASEGPQTVPLPKLDGVTAELQAFADAIQTGTPHRNSPEAALQDVAVIEAMLQSAEKGVHMKPERIV